MVQESHQSLRKRQSILGGQNRLGPGSARVNQSFSARNKGSTLLEVPEEPGALAPPRQDAGNLQSRGGKSHARVPSGMAIIPPRSASRAHAPAAQSSAGGEEMGLNLDPSLLEENFDAKSHIARLLSDASPEQIAEYAEKLKSQSAELTRREQAATRQNYQTMLQAAREISLLPGEVARLRKHVGDLSRLSTALREDAETQTMTRSQSQGTLDSAVNNKRNRNSVLTLNSAWAEDLLVLFRRVEGAQKYLPAIPGRHVVLESQGWYELNSVTWQPVQPVTLFLLNDHLLAATQKRLRATDTNSQRPLIVDRCWPLRDLKIVSLERNAGSGDSRADSPLAIQIHDLSGEVATLRAASAKLIATFMNDYERTRLALLSTNAKPANGHKRESSVGLDMERQRQGSIVVVEQQREGQIIIATIDIDISNRRYAKAVERCEAYKNHELVSSAVQERRDQLVSLLLELVGSDHVEKANQVENIKLLSTLGKAVEARSMFLEGRAAHIKNCASKVGFHDVVNYVSQIAIIYFQLILSTVDIYRQAFPEKKDASVIVEWCKTQVDEYVEIFNRQLYRIGNQTRIYKECVEISRMESQQLQRIGLDMDFMLSYAWA